MYGPAAQPPQPGQSPDITIHVDLTKPSVQLLSVDRRAGEGWMTIRWRASDANLDDMPVSLYYTDTVTGQWRPIARDLRNTGSFEWLMPPNLPSQIQVRVEAKDVAGNIATADTRNPIPVTVASEQIVRPTAQAARVQDVRPVGQGSPYRGQPYPVR